MAPGSLTYIKSPYGFAYSLNWVLLGYLDKNDLVIILKDDGGPMCQIFCKFGVCQASRKSLKRNGKW
jgi:hypothetical protein